MPKLCFCSIAFRDTPIAAIVPRLAELGYDGVEVWGPHLEGKPEPELAALRRLAEDAGIALEVLSPYFWLTNSEALRRESMERAARFVSYCQILGCRKIRTFTDCGPTGVSGRQATPAQWRLATACLQQIAALDRDIQFVVETHDQTLADTPADALRLLADVGAPNLALIFQCLDDSLLATWSQLRAHSPHIHLQNRSAEGSYAFLEDGVLDLPAFLGQLRREGYAGSLSVEYCGPGTTWERAASALTFLRRHL